MERPLEPLALESGDAAKILQHRRNICDDSGVGVQFVSEFSESFTSDEKMAMTTDDHSLNGAGRRNSKA